jgi:hypothetical protein
MQQVRTMLQAYRVFTCWHKLILLNPVIKYNLPPQESLS